MGLRRILLALSILTFLSATSGGTLYYSALRGAAVRQAEQEAAAKAELIRNGLIDLVGEHQKAVRTLAGIPALGEALHGRTEALPRVNWVLDHFTETQGADVCYLMDRNGITVASSNRTADDSFVGRDFAFRPYFQQAMAGAYGIYLALGSTSARRGVYHSYPVFTDPQHAPTGVAVIKASVDRAEKALRLSNEDILLVTDPQGVIFVSNRGDWLFQLAWPLSPEHVNRIENERQFGPGPLRWIGLSRIDSNRMRDSEGHRYLVYQSPLGLFEGWQLFYLRDMDRIARSVSAPLLRIVGPVVLLICILVGIGTLILYRKASLSIRGRKAAEEKLLAAKEALDRHSKELENQVIKRTGEISAILKYTPAVVYIKDPQGRYLLVNSRFEELFGISQTAAQGLSDHDLFRAEDAERFRANDLRVLQEDRSLNVEERVTQPDGDHTYLSVKFPIYEPDGSIRGVGGISTDITVLKAAQEQLRRLSGSIMINQEKERGIIARELHDELGQLLTALRMEAVWLQHRLKNSDIKGAERAGAMCALIDTTIEEVRAMALRLRPGVLDDLGLVDALEWYTSEFERRAQIPCIFTHDGGQDVNETVATAAYRIAQEALTNVARHAEAGRAEVALRLDDGTLELVVSDDGCGFDPTVLSDSQTLGLAGMHERAALVGGTLTVTSRLGNGTVLKLRVPHAYTPDESKQANL
jgi:PAS domain S-box-containing protein